MDNLNNGFELKTLLKLYNFFQIILNSYMVYGLYDIINQGIFNVPYSDNIEYFVNIHHISKYIDYIDTIFIILRKKNNQLSFLHVYHHSTVGMIWGFLLSIGHGNGSAGFGCLINSFIHVIMYSHYLMTSLGYSNPFKRYITQAQMAQFLILLIHSIIAISYEKIFPAKYAYIQLVYQIQMLLLFGNFYKKMIK